MAKRALVTGVTGQDGQHLAELLLAEGYSVVGMVSAQESARYADFREAFPSVELVNGDLGDFSSLIAAVEHAEPTEIYNLGGLSSVALSFEQPELTLNVTGLGVLRLLEAIRHAGGKNSRIRFYQASSSEMFGNAPEAPQTETTPFHPRSPYGVAKVTGHFTTMNYRETLGLFACSGILFNHEGPRRGLEFVTRKITNAAARIKLGLQAELVLGNLDSQRDWGYAGDYVRAMWLMLQQDEPRDYVIATGKMHSVRNFVEVAFSQLGLDWERHVRVDDRFLRPAEVDVVVGDARRARSDLGWEPQVSFSELVTMMVNHDLEVEEQRLRSAR